MIDDLAAAYQAYLERFAGQVGPRDIGEFAKHGGRLIKKLSHDEFAAAYLEYTEIAERYHDSLERGDTVNDLVLRMLREQAATLVLAPPA